MLQRLLEGFKGIRDDNWPGIFVTSYLLLYDSPSVKCILVYTCILIYEKLELAEFFGELELSLKLDE